MSAVVVKLEIEPTDVRRQESPGSFLGLSSIQSAIAPERTRALKQLDATVCRLERLASYRPVSSVDLEPYTSVLRSHLRDARRRLGDPRNTSAEQAFLDAAFRLAGRLRELLPEPITVRTRPEHPRTLTG